MTDRLVRYSGKFFEDVAQATQWYDQQRFGLGQQFLDALNDKRSSIKRSPESYAIFDRSIRICMLRRFPYGIFFRCSSEEICFLGVLHLHRECDFAQSQMRQRDENTDDVSSPNNLD